jgi:hypothetical protein
MPARESLRSIYRAPDLPQRFSRSASVRALASGRSSAT